LNENQKLIVTHWDFEKNNFSFFEKKQELSDQLDDFSELVK